MAKPHHKEEGHKEASKAYGQGPRRKTAWRKVCQDPDGGGEHQSQDSAVGDPGKSGEQGLHQSGKEIESRCQSHGKGKEDDPLGEHGGKVSHDQGQQGPVDGGQEGLIVPDHHKDHGAADAGNDHGPC